MEKCLCFGNGHVDGPETLEDSQRASQRDQRLNMRKTSQKVVTTPLVHSRFLRLESSVLKIYHGCHSGLEGAKMRKGQEFRAAFATGGILRVSKPPSNSEIYQKGRAFTLGTAWAAIMLV